MRSFRSHFRNTPTFIEHWARPGEIGQRINLWVPNREVTNCLCLDLGADDWGDQNNDADTPLYTDEGLIQLTRYSDCVRITGNLNHVDARRPRRNGVPRPPATPRAQGMGGNDAMFAEGNSNRLFARAGADLRGARAPGSAPRHAAPPPPDNSSRAG